MAFKEGRIWKNWFVYDKVNLIKEKDGPVVTINTYNTYNYLIMQGIVGEKEVKKFYTE